MTPLERLKELNEKATPGPWELYVPKSCRYERMGIEGRGWGSIVVFGTAEDDSGVDGDNNARIMVATRNLLPELLALWEAVNELSVTRSEFMGENVWGIEKVLDLRSVLNARAEEIMK